MKTKLDIFFTHPTDKNFLEVMQEVRQDGICGDMSSGDYLMDSTSIKAMVDEHPFLIEENDDEDVHWCCDTSSSDDFEDDKIYAISEGDGHFHTEEIDNVNTLCGFFDLEFSYCKKCDRCHKSEECQD